MKPTLDRLSPALALLALTASPPAQAGVRDVPPGREVRETKLLSFGKTDRWDLEVAAGEVLLCRVQTTAFDPVLQLVDDAGAVLAQDDGRGTQSEVWYRMQGGGKAAFKVAGYEGAGGGSYSFFLQRFETQDVAVGASLEHRFGREQWWNYALHLEKGDVLVPTVTGQGRLTAVFHMDRTHLGAVHGGYEVRDSGLHFVRVEGRHEHACRVHLALARQRDLGAEGALDDVLPAHGLDIWRVRLRALEPMFLPLRMTDGILQFDVRERVPGEGPAFVWTGSMDRGGLRRRWLMPRRNTTVELLLRNPHGHAARYSGAFAPTGEVLAAGGGVRGTLERCGASLFRLHTTPGELLRVRAESAAFDAQIDVWDREGNIIHKNDDTSLADPNPSLTFPVERPGDHWVLVFCPGGGGSGPFDVRVDSLPIRAVEVGRPARLELRKGEAKYLHLALAEGQPFWLSLRAGSHAVTVNLFAPDGTLLGRHSGGGVDRDVLFGRRAERGGRYTLRIDGGAGPADLRVIEP